MLVKVVIDPVDIFSENWSVLFLSRICTIRKISVSWFQRNLNEAKRSPFVQVTLG